MSLLEGLTRKKNARVTETRCDAPTLFGGTGPAPAGGEKTISVLSAVGAKPAGRSRSGTLQTRRSARRVSPVAVLLGTLLGAIVTMGVWQSRHPDTDLIAALERRLDAGVVAGTKQRASDAAHAREPDTESAAHAADAPRASGSVAPQAAVIERVALVPAAPLAEDGRAPVAASDDERDGAAQAPAPLRRAPAPRSGAPAERSVKAPPTAVTTRQATDAHDKMLDRKVQVARAKESDADARLLEALLIHLRKPEPARNGAR